MLNAVGEGFVLCLGLAQYPTATPVENIPVVRSQDIPDGRNSPSRPYYKNAGSAHVMEATMKTLYGVTFLTASLLLIPMMGSANAEERSGAKFTALKHIVELGPKMSDEELSKVEGGQAQVNTTIGGGLVSVQVPINANDVVDVTVRNNQIGVNVLGQQGQLQIIRP
jgi:hypothetical protein